MPPAPPRHRRASPPTTRRVATPRPAPSLPPVAARQHPNAPPPQGRGWGGGHRPCARRRDSTPDRRSEEHTSELQSLMRISYADLCLKNNKHKPQEYRHYPTSINNTT